MWRGLGKPGTDGKVPQGAPVTPARPFRAAVGEGQPPTGTMAFGRRAQPCRCSLGEGGVSSLGLLPEPPFGQSQAEIGLHSHDETGAGMDHNGKKRSGGPGVSVVGATYCLLVIVRVGEHPSKVQGG